jgi:hypothetical protein
VRMRRVMGDAGGGEGCVAWSRWCEQSKTSAACAARELVARSWGQALRAWREPLREEGVMTWRPRGIRLRSASYAGTRRGPT